MFEVLFVGGYFIVLEEITLSLICLSVGEDSGGM